MGLILIPSYLYRRENLNTATGTPRKKTVWRQPCDDGVRIRCDIFKTRNSKDFWKNLPKLPQSPSQTLPQKEPPWWHHELMLPASRVLRQWISVFQATQSVALGYGSLSKLTHRTRPHWWRWGVSLEGTEFGAESALDQQVRWALAWAEGRASHLLWDQRSTGRRCWGLGKPGGLPLLVEVHRLLWPQEQLEPDRAHDSSWRGHGCILFSVLYFPSITPDPRRVSQESTAVLWDTMLYIQDEGDKRCPGGTTRGTIAVLGPWQAPGRGSNRQVWRPCPWPIEGWPFGKCSEISGGTFWGWIIHSKKSCHIWSEYNW